MRWIIINYNYLINFMYIYIYINNLIHSAYEISNKSKTVLIDINLFQI